MIDRVAVIGGTGEEGFGLAGRWASSGIEIVIGSRVARRAEEAADRLRTVVPGASVRGMGNAHAAGAAPVVVVTVPFAGQAETYAALADHLSPDAVVVDCTAPLAAAVGGKPWHTLGVWAGSAAEQGAGILDHRALVCSAFHSLSAATLSDLAADLEGDVLVCGPPAGKKTVAALVEAIPRLRFVDAGPLANARLIEPITALLIGINRRYKVPGAGIRITGLPD